MPIALEVMTKPTIHILTGPGASPAVLRDVMLGLEEEGVPCEVAERPAGDALALAWEAAQASRLEVGIGLDGETLILHYDKLQPSSPLFQVSAQAGSETARALGANGARLVKRLPLKPLGGR